MMLTVQTAEPETVTLRLIRDGEEIRAVKAEGKGETLRLLARLLKPAEIHRVTAVAAAMAGGSFSHLRSVAATVNALAFVLGSPAVGGRAPLSASREVLRGLERRVRRRPRTSIVRPAYSGEPNITIPRT